MDLEKKKTEIRMEILETDRDTVGIAKDGGIKTELVYPTVCEEHNKIISELNKKLENVNAEKLKDFDTREGQMKEHLEKSKQQLAGANKIIKGLRDQLSESLVREEIWREKNMEACETIEDLRQRNLAAEAHRKMICQKQTEADSAVEELKRQNLEAFRTIEELRRAKLEADCTVKDLKQQILGAYRVAEVLGKRFEDLAPMAKGLVHLLNAAEDRDEEVAFPVSIKGNTHLPESSPPVRSGVKRPQSETSGHGEDNKNNYGPL